MLLSKSTFNTLRMQVKQLIGFCIPPPPLFVTGSSLQPTPDPVELQEKESLLEPRVEHGERSGPTWRQEASEWLGHESGGALSSVMGTEHRGRRPSVSWCYRIIWHRPRHRRRTVTGIPDLTLTPTFISTLSITTHTHTHTHTHIFCSWEP